MKKVLMIAPYFVPRRRVGAQRPFKFAVHLHKFGWDPAVITIADSDQELSESEKKLLQNVEITEIKSPFDRTTSNKSTSEEKKTLPGISDWMSDRIDKHVPMDTWIFLLRMKYRNILKAAKQTAADLVWSTGDPWSGHWLGEKLSRDLTVPWIADFRDPWTLSEINLRDRSAFSLRADRYFEKKYIEKADRLVFTSKQTTGLYCNHYNIAAQKAHTIYNSFDPLIHSDQAEEWEGTVDNNLFNIFFFGRFRRLSPVNTVLKALLHLKEYYPELAGKIRIHSFGIPDGDQLSLIKEQDAEINFVVHQPVLPEMTLPVLKKADMLLLSTRPERKNIIPAKLWDYLAAGVPVLSVAPNPEISEILENSGSGKQFSPSDITGITEFITAGINCEGIFNGRKRLDGVVYSAEETAKQLASIMDELTADGN